MEVNERVTNGFFLALYVLDSLDVEYAHADVLRCLEAAQADELPLSEVQEEELDMLRSHQGAESDISETIGFFLALYVLDNLSVEFNDRAAVFRTLADVASGDVTLLNSPQEELAVMERRRGEPVTAEEREEFLRGFDNRPAMDAHNRLVAVRIVRTMQSIQKRNNAQ